MTVSKSDSLPIRSSTDIVLIRQEVRKWSGELGFSLVDQTKMITAASELARNSLDYGGGGAVRLEVIENGIKRGLRLSFEDQGPGIPDIQQALTDGFTTGKGMGLGWGVPNDSLTSLKSPRVREKARASRSRGGNDQFSRLIHCRDRQ